VTTAQEPPRSVQRHAFLRPMSLPRQMRADNDPLLRDGGSAEERRALRVLLYGEVCTSWRELVGVRFKLLGFVPAVSVVGLATLLGSDSITDLVGAGVSLVGAIITFALFLYDQRNSQLHDELISRGRRIEQELGIDVGQFRGRPGSRGIVKHDYATVLVYVTTLLAWLGAGVSFAVG
jgi:hypothetical protein